MIAARLDPDRFLCRTLGWCTRSNICGTWLELTESTRRHWSKRRRTHWGRCISTLPVWSSHAVVSSNAIRSAGPLWWLCSNVATSSEPFEAVWELADQIRSDRTASELAAALPDESQVVTIGDPSVIAAGLARRGDVRVLALDIDHSATSFVHVGWSGTTSTTNPSTPGQRARQHAVADVVLLEVLAMDETRMVLPSGSSTIAAAATAWETPVWAVAGVGRRLPSACIDAMAEKCDALAAHQRPVDARHRGRPDAFGNRRRRSPRDHADGSASRPGRSAPSPPNSSAPSPCDPSCAGSGPCPSPGCPCSPHPQAFILCVAFLAVPTTSIATQTSGHAALEISDAPGGLLESRHRRCTRLSRG